MNYSSNMDGLDLFTEPFRNQNRSMATPQPKVPVSPAQPVKFNPPAEQAKKPDVPQKPVPEQKNPQMFMEPTKEKNKAPEPKQKPQADTSADTQVQPKKELILDMSDRTIPAGNPLDTSEDDKRRAHEEAEARRRAEWEAGQLAKKQAEQEAIQKMQSMSDADVVSASTERIRTDVERLTRRNMKECVAEHIQNICQKDPAFARKTMHPKKSMVHCFRYINRRAKDYIRQEMEDNDIKPDAGGYGGDVPDGLCYQWAEDYFNDPDAQEDKEKEEKFVPKPYTGTPSKTKKTAKLKNTTKKESEKKKETKNDCQQMSFMEVL